MQVVRTRITARGNHADLTIVDIPRQVDGGCLS